MIKSFPKKKKSDEIWKDIVGFEGMYQVSNIGRVKCLKRQVFNKANGTMSTIRGCIRKPDMYNKLYAQVGIWKDSKTTKFLIHRLVAIHFVPNPNNLPEVNHIDLDKTNNRADNLEWVTRKQNAQHAHKLGRYDNFQKGTERPNSILTDDAVRHIRKKIMRNIDYCRMYGVKPSTITMIQKDTKRWSHV